MEDFYKIAEEVHKDRINYKYWNENSLDNQAKLEYLNFCIWCRAFKNADFSENNFIEYQKKENKSINFWVKKRICELFFEYKFEFDYDNMKWKYKKVIYQ